MKTLLIATVLAITPPAAPDFTPPEQVVEPMQVQFLSPPPVTCYSYRLGNTVVTNCY